MPKKKATKKKSSRSYAPPTYTPAEKRRAKTIYNKLLELYPDAHCALIHKNPWELLVATILSAQCTDVLVNKVTPDLFRAYPTPQATAKADLEDIRNLVNKVNFWQNKAKSIHNAAKMVVTDFNGAVPTSMDELIKLPGVARKTANVVLGNAFNINHGVVVDTHIARLSHRYNFTKHKDPKKIEQDLMALFPRDTWTMLAHLLIYHGRQVCKSRHALCDQSPLCTKYCSNAKIVATERANKTKKKAVKKKATKKKAKIKIS
ncbi:Ultraviolet N-glycosylase/AP lyase [Poriferisphaera corsica]|uniref:Endonuclease III n=1 Tax=Poriferisphaera corsica TaxID=2528020 RepID=A0A517YWX7_9BACT|nr:endonuclease III [Poriferisphaera corsica]QDU34734.1 Ultraviolet N-glycosylase/AP lyase [Poriferisphaera corsica]